RDGGWAHVRDREPRLARPVSVPCGPPRGAPRRRGELSARDRRRLQRDRAGPTRLTSPIVKAIRALLVACACALVLSGSAAAKPSNDFAGHTRQVFPVYVVKGLTLADLPELATEGAVGIMVPNAGPMTSQGAAFAGMVRGILYNTRLPRPRDIVLIHVKATNSIPQHGPAIVVGLPPGIPSPNDRRYPIAVIGHGYHGLLTSSLTRVPGLVSIADVARTALQTPHALDTQRDGGPVA